MQCESIIDNCIRLRHAPTKAELPELTERLRDALIDEEQITAETFRSSKAEILLEEGQAVSGTEYVFRYILSKAASLCC